jgi:hypothetical protein
MSTKEEELQDFLSTKNSNGTTTVITGINTSNSEALLSNLNFSLAAQKIILDPTSFDTDASGLESIASASELLIQIRGSLGDILHS